MNYTAKPRMPPPPPPPEAAGAQYYVMTLDEEFAPAASRPAQVEEVQPPGRQERHCGSGFELVLDATVPQLGREIGEVPLSYKMVEDWMVEQATVQEILAVQDRVHGGGGEYGSAPLNRLWTPSHEPLGSAADLRIPWHRNRSSNASPNKLRTVLELEFPSELWSRPSLFLHLRIPELPSELWNRSDVTVPIFHGELWSRLSIFLVQVENLRSELRSRSSMLFLNRWGEALLAQILPPLRRAWRVAATPACGAAGGASRVARHRGAQVCDVPVLFEFPLIEYVDRIQQRPDDHAVDIPFSQVVVEPSEVHVPQAIPQERTSERIQERIPQQIVDVPELRAIPQERTSERISEPIIDAERGTSSSAAVQLDTAECAEDGFFSHFFPDPKKVRRSAGSRVRTWRRTPPRPRILPMTSDGPRRSSDASTGRTGGTGSTEPTEGAAGAVHLQEHRLGQAWRC